MNGFIIEEIYSPALGFNLHTVFVTDTGVSFSTYHHQNDVYCPLNGCKVNVFHVHKPVKYKGEPSSIKQIIYNRSNSYLKSIIVVVESNATGRLSAMYATEFENGNITM